MGAYLVIWKHKKQNSSAKVKCCAIIYATCELMWIQNLLKGLGGETKKLIVMFCDNQATTCYK